MAIKPWNFPTYRACGTYNFGYDGDPYYQTNGHAADFADNGKVTVIGAVLIPIGSGMSGQSQNTTATSSSWPPLFTLSWPGAVDASIGVRPGWYQAGNTSRAISFYMYNSAGAYKGTMQPTIEQLLTNNDIQAEGQMLQYAISVDGATGKKQIAINGQVIVNGSEAAWGTSAPLNLHGAGTARAAFNAYANWNTSTWSSGGTGREWIIGPHLVHHTWIDLADAAVRAKIWDDNGDFLWAGQDGSEWLNGTVPWYFSELGVPWHGNKGTNTGTWNRVTSTSYARWGAPCGSKWDWPNSPRAELLYVRDNMPGLKGAWDLSSVTDESNYFLYNQFFTMGHLKRYSTSYTETPALPHREGAIGSVGNNYGGGTGIQGYTAVSSVTNELVRSATDIYMTICLDFTESPTANFGFKKVIGWRTGSSSSYFAVYSCYPAGNSRNIVLQWQATSGGMLTTGSGGNLPANTGVMPFTFCFNSGIIRMFRGMTKTVNANYVANGTALFNGASTFGFFDYTSSNSGLFSASADWVSIGLGNPTDTQILDLHALLLEGAYT